jgi:hypothetical protein
MSIVVFAKFWRWYVTERLWRMGLWGHQVLVVKLDDFGVEGCGNVGVNVKENL